MIIIIIIAGDYMETTATFILNLLSFLGQNMWSQARILITA